MKLVGCYDSMGGRVMPGRPQKECEAGTRNLVHLYERALAEAPQELVKLDEVLHGNGTLPALDHNLIKTDFESNSKNKKNTRQESFLRIPDRIFFCPKADL